ncbi:unnamed protein product, partial [Closterium sp. NIES-54]
TFTLPTSQQQNGIAERRIGMVMDVAHTSMIHAAAPHFLWPFAVQYAAHQINLQPRVSLQETTPTLRWSGKVGDASVFRVWGSQAFVRNTSADKLSSLGILIPSLSLLHCHFPPPASLPNTRCSSGRPPPPSGSCPLRGAEPAGAGPGGAEPGSRGAKPGGAEPERAESGGSPGFPSRREPLSCSGYVSGTLGAVAMLLELRGMLLEVLLDLEPFYVLGYIDNLVFSTADTKALAHVKSELQKRHTCTDLGEQINYLGLRITWVRAQRTITLTQSHMVHQVLERFGFTYSSPQSTPLPTGHSLSAPPSDESVEPSGPYPVLVGCLMYLMTCTRPDLAYPLSILARYVAPDKHRKEHMDAAKRVLSYLCSTSGMGLVLGGRARVVLTGHVDASWVDDLATQRSSQGYTFSLGSGSVSWRSTRSSSVLSSSCEVEIYTGAMAAQELRWLTYLLTDLGEPPRSLPVPYVNNKAIIALCQEHRLEHRTKHIALRFFLA